MSVLGKVQSCTVDFAEKLRHELGSASDLDVAAVLQTVFAVLEPIPGKRCAIPCSLDGYCRLHLTPFAIQHPGKRSWPISLISVSADLCMD